MNDEELKNRFQNWSEKELKYELEISHDLEWRNNIIKELKRRNAYENN